MKMNNPIVINYRGIEVVIKLNEEGYIDHDSQHLLETIFPGSTARPGGYMPGVVVPWIQKHYEVSVQTDSNTDE